MSQSVTAAIAGTGRYLPDRSIDNRELVAREDVRANFDVERARNSLRGHDGREDLSDADVFDRWTRQVTGIEARRMLLPETGLTTEDMCARAAGHALTAAGMEAGDLDMIYVASLTCADEVPNAACTVADRLGVPKIGGFTINAACAGFVYALATAWTGIASGWIRNALVVSGDTLSRFVDWTDMRTAVLFGDGAGAAVLTRDETGERGVLGRPVCAGEFDREPLYMIGQGWETEDEPEPKLHMSGGPRILRNAIHTMARAAGEALESGGLTWSDVDIVIPHQANLRITLGLEKHLDLPRGRVIHNIQRYGNMSASTVGVTLDEVLRGEHGEIPRPATIVLTAIGGGYTTAASVIRV